MSCIHSMKTCSSFDNLNKKGEIEKKTMTLKLNPQEIYFQTQLVHSQTLWLLKFLRINLSTLFVVNYKGWSQTEAFVDWISQKKAFTMNVKCQRQEVELNLMLYEMWYSQRKWNDLHHYWDNCWQSSHLIWWNLRKAYRALCELFSRLLLKVWKA